MNSEIPASRWVESRSTHNAGYQIHRIQSRRDWAYPLHRHDGFCELVFGISGEFENRINNQPFRQGRGQVTLVREQDSHRLRGSHFEYVNLMFPRDWIPRLESFLRLGGLTDAIFESNLPPRARIQGREFEEIESRLSRLQTLSQSRAGLSFFAEFLVQLVSRHLMAEPDRAAWPPDLPVWMQDALVTLARDPQPSFQTSDLIRLCGRSAEHISRTFSRKLGTTPSAYLAGLKIDHAANLLATTNRTAREVCFAAGFENESYYYRLFRARKGMTPMDYRRAHGPPRTVG
ncbi:MAG: AraC family transcriptional regulator [Kiritimatiellia bacterium]|nr:AraC family transcriptional regulator [Kiritimatiellia bacterium]